MWAPPQPPLGGKDMERKKASDFDQGLLDLFDRYVHGGLSSREFLDRAKAFAASGVSAIALLESLSPKYAEAQQVPKDDSRLKTEYIHYDSPKGYGKVKAYLCRPAAASGKLGGVVVIHENRGLQPHIRDVARRAALAGYVALAPDLMSAIGGTPASEDEARTKFAQVDVTVAFADALKSIEYLRGRPDAAGKIGVVGFCWGGSMVGRIAASGADVQAAVVFYGTAPAVEQVPAIKTPLLLHYAGIDERVNATVPPFEAALKAGGKTYTLHMYEGVQHAFHNDTSAARYNADAAKLAWTRTIEFFDKTLK
jgi:carboxymethylenebutenolidase